ncbi:ricin-type beta-trefoil lectin domain protein [Streptomyces sp. VRA16 Mangrove soil]|uniref:ricin-type beta-trefoil lectin domain protein n=1 Tax=Streptomyces sp. VRA16 Mangrove soil TaxID=2817434 RepID=UPI001A9D80CA|nr:RICIN domain-containing protein [Streptomyces sp. VRA16 Mangrove soil]MBO1330000.1 ricin-type beta-trefoil lectin domain protein [Streptomyces sp. VRA16 Mangrove soil]
MVAALVTVLGAVLLSVVPTVPASADDPAAGSQPGETNWASLDGGYRLPKTVDTPAQAVAPTGGNTYVVERTATDTLVVGRSHKESGTTTYTAATDFSATAGAATSPSAPSAVGLRDGVVVAHRGASDNRVYVTWDVGRSPGDFVPWVPLAGTTSGDVKTIGTPTMTVLDGRLVFAWTTPDNTVDIMFGSIENGAFDADDHPTEIAGSTTSSSPGIAAFGDGLWLVRRDADSRIEYTSSIDAPPYWRFHDWKVIPDSPAISGRPVIAASGKVMQVGAIGTTTLADGGRTLYRVNRGTTLAEDGWNEHPAWTTDPQGQHSPSAPGLYIGGDGVISSVVRQPTGGVTTSAKQALSAAAAAGTDTEAIGKDVQANAPAVTPRDLGDVPLVSWNMQGAADGTDAAKWTVSVARLARQSPIVALQEAGPSYPVRPPNTEFNVYDVGGNHVIDGLEPGLQVTTRNLANPEYNASFERLPAAQVPDPSTGLDGLGRIVTHTQWHIGSGDTALNRDVYFLHTDAYRRDGRTTYRGGRVNLAFVTERAADEVAAIASPQGGTARATLGLRFGDTWYFNLHALSGGGADAGLIVHEIADFVSGRARGENWVAMGDFNRTPESLQQGSVTLPAGAAIFRNGLSTQRSGNELDYFVSSGAVNGVQVNRLTNPELPLSDPARSYPSDHAPVALGALRAAAERVPVFDGNRALENMLAGGVLTGGSDTIATTTVRDHTPPQSTSVLMWPDGSVRLGNLSGCLGTADPAVVGSVVVTGDCTDGTNQRWFPQYMGDGEFRLISMNNTGLCMVGDTRGDPKEEAEYVVLKACASPSTADERWIFTPQSGSISETAAPANLSYSRTGWATLENLHVGGVMDVIGDSTDNNATVGQYERRGGSNQGWNLDWVSSETTMFRGTHSNRCLGFLGGSTARSSDLTGQQLVVSDCEAGRASQEWRAVQLENDLVNWQSVADPSQCIDVAGAPTDPDVGNLILYPCGDGLNQQWLFTPYDPTGTPSLPQEWVDL